MARELCRAVNDALKAFSSRRWYNNYPRLSLMLKCRSLILRLSNWVSRRMLSVT